MSQPKLPPDLAEQLRYLGLVVSCYQPVTHFKPGTRKLPNVPNPDDPWQVFLRRHGEIGVLAVAYGETLREAIDAAIYMRPGISGAMIRLGDACGDLAETIKCR